MILSVDLGGTRVKLGLLESGRLGEVIAQETLSSESQQGLSPRLPVIQTTLERMLLAAGGQPTAIGVAIPGIVDHERARVRSINGKWLDAPNVDLSAWARSAWGIPLVLENDANAALFGEWRFGAGQGSDDVAMMTLGTGIGCAALIQGKPLRGRHGQAGILAGHITVRIGGRACSCGNRGCLDAEASSGVLDAIAREDSRFATSALADEDSVDYRRVFAAARAGDELAVELRDQSIEAWAAGVVNLIHAFDPEVVVVGGGIMASAEEILPSLEEYVHRHAWTAWGRVRVRPAERGAQAALFGMAWLAEGSA